MSEDKRMASTDTKSIDTKLTELVGRLKESAGANLESVILYGSAARGDFHEKHSDLNVLCTMTSLAAGELKRVSAVVKWWTREQKEPAPLFFTEKELRESADVFAIELTDMQRDHRVVYGKDAVVGIVVPMNLHRVQVEHELRTTLLKLRQHFLHAAGDEAELASILAKSISSVTTLLRHALLVMGEPAPREALEVFARVAALTKTDASAFEAGLALRGHGAHAGDANAAYAAYLQAVERVIETLGHHAPKHEWQRASK